MKMFYAFLLLMLVDVATAQRDAANCDLLISEVVDGSGNDKAIELYNASNASIDLSRYRITRHRNGAPDYPNCSGCVSVALKGTLAAGDVVILANGQFGDTQVGGNVSAGVSQTLKNIVTNDGGWFICYDTVFTGTNDVPVATDCYNSNASGAPMYINGDDAVSVDRLTAANLTWDSKAHTAFTTTEFRKVDIFGEIGFQPNGCWRSDAGNDGKYNTGKCLTASKTLRRKATVWQGVTVNPNGFNTFAQYDTLPKNTLNGLGTHSMTVTDGCFPLSAGQPFGADKVSLYPNPAASGASVVVSTVDQPLIKVQLLDTRGRILATYSYADRVLRRYVSIPAQLPHGIYLLQATTEAGAVATHKLVVE